MSNTVTAGSDLSQKTSAMNAVSLATQSEELVQITDPNTGKTFYANTITGECSWDLPENARVRPRDPNGVEWWELYDENSDMNYYYNTSTQETEWSRPSTGVVIPLTAIQKSAIGRSAFGGSTYSMSSQEKLTTESRRESLLRSSSNAAEQEAESSGSPIPPPPPQPPLPKSQSQSGANQLGQSPTHVSHVSSGNLEGSSESMNARSNTSASIMNKFGFIRASQNSLAAQKARSLGISNPKLDAEAAAAMNPLNPSNSNKSIASLAQEARVMPSSLKDDISQFKIDGFAKKYFSQHRQGLFQRKVPIEKMLGFQKEPIKAPLLVLNANLHKDALKCFRYIQKIMSAKDEFASVYEDISSLIEKGLRFGGLRDEIYIQLCKQLINNPTPESVFKGWQLMDILTASFPPSKHLDAYLQNFIVESREKQIPGEKLHTIIKHTAFNLTKIMKAGPRGRTLSPAEVDQCLAAPFINSVFGDSLENIMERQKEVDPTIPIPKILSFLVDGILQLNGAKTEGIFRVPGDAEGVSDLRCRIDKGQYDLNGIADPNVPGSLLKLWLRELSEPLIPSEFYAACISVGASDGRISHEDMLKQTVEILETLPPINKKVVYFVLKFLQVVAQPENQAITKMTNANLAMVFAPNFLRCPSDNPATIFENTKFEQAFLRALILGPLPDRT